MEYQRIQQWTLLFLHYLLVERFPSRFHSFQFWKKNIGMYLNVCWIFFSHFFLHRIHVFIEDSNPVSFISICCSDTWWSNLIELKHIGIFIPGSKIPLLYKVTHSWNDNPYSFLSSDSKIVLPRMSGHLPRDGTGAITISMSSNFKYNNNAAQVFIFTKYWCLKKHYT